MVPDSETLMNRFQLFRDGTVDEDVLELGSETTDRLKSISSGVQRLGTGDRLGFTDQSLRVQVATGDLEWVVDIDTSVPRASYEKKFTDEAVSEAAQELIRSIEAL